jgi:hypothetical protein
MMPRSRTGRRAAPAVRAVAVGDVARLSGSLIAPEPLQATSEMTFQGMAETFHKRRLNQSEPALVVR